MTAERFTEHLRQNAAGTWEGHIGTRLCGGLAMERLQAPRHVRCPLFEKLAIAMIFEAPVFRVGFSPKWVRIQCCDLCIIQGRWRRDDSPSNHCGGRVSIDTIRSEGHRGFAPDTY